METGESDANALEREVMHRLGVSVKVGSLISFVSHRYERYTVDLHLYECSIAQGEPSEQNVFAYRWVTSREFDQYPFTPADEASMSKLLGVD